MHPAIVIGFLLLAAVPSAAHTHTPSPEVAREAFDAYLAGLPSDGSGQRERDVNCDGAVTPGDARAVYERYLLGLPAPPCFARDANAGAARLHLRHRAVVAAPGAPARYEVALDIENTTGFEAFGVRLAYPTDELELVAMEVGSDIEHWIAVGGVENAPGEITVAGFDSGPDASPSPLRLMVFVFAVHATTVDGRRIVVRELSDDLAHAEVMNDAGARDAPHPTPVSYRVHPGSSRSTCTPTVIQLDVPAGKDRARLRLAVHDATGQLVRVLVDDTRDPGFYEVEWDGTNQSGTAVAPGIYYCRLQTPHGFAGSSPVRID